MLPGAEETRLMGREVWQLGGRELVGGKGRQMIQLRLCVLQKIQDLGGQE